MDLSEIIGQPGVDEIKATGAIRFHAVGDSGRPGGDAPEQGHVADAMKDDYDPAAGTIARRSAGCRKDRCAPA
jgi:hypothetical protein